MKIFAIILLLCTAIGLSAQPNKKVAPALSKFLNTEFMIKYRDLRIQAESAAISVQSQQDQMKPEDRARLRSAYDQTASRANQLLESIKLDLLNAKKLKTISDFPEMYSDGMRLKLTELSDFYAANFQQLLADISVDKKQEVDGSAILLLTIELIGLTKGLAGYFAEIRREARQYTEKYLGENLVQPYRWRYWDELAGNASPYEKFDKSSEADLKEPAGEDQLDRQLQKVNQTIQALPSKDNNTPPDEFSLPPDASGTPDSTFQYEDWSPTMTPPVDTIVGQRDTAPNNLKKKPKSTIPAQKMDKKAKPAASGNKQ